MRAAAACAGALALLSMTRDARAVDLPPVGGTPPKLDITETSIVAQRFEAREGENPNDQGYGAWLNRLNLVLSWKKWTVGLRLDSSTYWLRPQDRSFRTVQEQRNALIDGSTRFRDSIFPAKAWVTYRSGAIEATVGDSYVQFGRGLVLSLRKVDELGLDTTLLGGKLVAQSDPFAATLIAGIANPSRVDEPSGRSLLLPSGLPGDRLGPQPLFGSDRIVGAQIQAGRGLPVVASTHAVMVTKCAPYAYNADGTVADKPFWFVNADAPVGTCNESDVETWLGTLPTNQGPVLASKRTINAGQSLEIPSLGGHGNLYLEAAVQRRDPERTNLLQTEGNAIYGSFVLTGGSFSNTFEMKSYRNFYPLTGGINTSRATAFANVAYSAPPTAEVVTQDAMFGFYNACVTGGRDRLDYRVGENAVIYGAVGYFQTRSESPGGQCDRLGRSTADDPADTTNHVIDVSAGGQYTFDGARSIAFVNVAHRDDTRDNGEMYYRERILGTYTLTKHIAGPYAVEVTGRARWREQDLQNLVGTETQPWVEWENYTALKIAPKWVFSQGVETTSFVGYPAWYVNGGVIYRFTSQSNLRVFAGQNRPGLKCVSGICRFFPAFSGARVELTLRF